MKRKEDEDNDSRQIIEDDIDRQTDRIHKVKCLLWMWENSYITKKTNSCKPINNTTAGTFWYSDYQVKIL